MTGAETHPILSEHQSPTEVPQSWWPQEMVITRCSVAGTAAPWGSPVGSHVFGLHSSLLFPFLLTVDTVADHMCRGWRVSVICWEMVHIFSWISAYIHAFTVFYRPTFYKLKALPYWTELIQFTEKHDKSQHQWYQMLLLRTFSNSQSWPTPETVNWVNHWGAMKALVAAPLCCWGQERNQVLYLTYFHDGFCYYPALGQSRAVRWEACGELHACHCHPLSTPVWVVFRAGASHLETGSGDAASALCLMERGSRWALSYSPGSSHQDSVNWGWWIPVALEWWFPHLKDQPRLWGCLQTCSHAYHGIAWPGSMWFVLPCLGSWSLEVRELQDVLSFNCYNLGYSHEIRSVSILHQTVGNKYFKYSTEFFSS